VSGYRLYDRAIQVRSLAETKGFFSLASLYRPAVGSTQTPVQWVPGVLYPGLKRGRGVTLTTHPQIVPRSRMSRSYTSYFPGFCVASSGTALALGSVVAVAVIVGLCTACWGRLSFIIRDS
jgi:hypothetical protein